MVASDGAVLTLDGARDHLRIGTAVTDEALAPLVAAAEGRIESFLGRDLVGSTGWLLADDVPPLVVHCCRLALSDFYVNREAPELTDDQLRPMIGRYMAISVG